MAALSNQIAHGWRIRAGNTDLGGACGRTDTTSPGNEHADFIDDTGGEQGNAERASPAMNGRVVLGALIFGAVAALSFWAIKLKRKIGPKCNVVSLGQILWRLGLPSTQAWSGTEAVVAMSSRDDHSEKIDSAEVSVELVELIVDERQKGEREWQDTPMRRTRFELEREHGKQWHHEAENGGGHEGDTTGSNRGIRGGGLGLGSARMGGAMSAQYQRRKERYDNGSLGTGFGPGMWNTKGPGL